MQGQQTQKDRRNVILSFVLAAASWQVYGLTGPALWGPEIRVVPALALVVLCVAGFKFVVDCLWYLGALFEWLQAVMPTGLKGTGGFIRSWSELKGEIVKGGAGPYFGFFRNRAVISDYEACALSVGTTGSGKSVGSVIPNSLSIPHGKCHFDFKGSLACQLAEPLRRRGERVRLLNFAGLYKEIIGETDRYNPTCIVSDCFWRPGGLMEVGEILSEMAFQLYPEPKSNSGTSDNEYFRSGSRSLIEFSVLTCVLIDGENATLGDAYSLLMDRERLLHHALWACGKLPIEPEGAAPAPSSTPLDDFGSNNPPATIH